MFSDKGKTCLVCIPDRLLNIYCKSCSEFPIIVALHVRNEFLALIKRFLLKVKKKYNFVLEIALI